MKKCSLVLLALLLVFGMYGTAAAAKDTLVVADQYDATTMDPIGHNDMPTSRLNFAVFDTLIMLDDAGNTVPGLAEKWDFISPQEYKFYLRKGVKFHNGEELKASDVQFSLMRAKSDLGAQVASFTTSLESVEVVDDYTLVIHLNVPDYYFFSSLSHHWAAIMNKKAVDEAGESVNMTPVGTGPFKLLSWQRADNYVLERFDDFWGEKAKIKNLRVRSIPEPTNRMIELETGGVDVAYPIANNDLQRLEENKDLTLYREPQTSITYMGFNMSKKPFDDVRVRKAISLAIDVVGVQAAVWRGVGKVPNSLVPGAIKWSIDAEVPAHKQDVEQAKKLLEEAGIKDLKFEIWTNERKERVDMATIIQAQLAEIGVTVDIKVLEWGAFLNGLRLQTHDLYILGWVSSVPHANGAISGLLESNGGSNYTFTSDPKIDELLVKGRATPPDSEECGAVYKELQLYINDLTPMIYLHNDESIAGSQTNVKNFKPSSGELHSFREVYIED